MHTQQTKHIIRSADSAVDSIQPEIVMNPVQNNGTWSGHGGHERERGDEAATKSAARLVAEYGESLRGM
jgi:hypothetical protein